MKKRAPAPKEGDACPIITGRTTHDCCAITNACDGPGSQLLSLFAFVSTIDEPIVSSTILDSTSAFVPPAPPLLYRLATPRRSSAQKLALSFRLISSRPVPI